MTVRVLEPSPGAVREAGAKVAVMPDGTPLVPRVTGALNPPDIEIVAGKVALPPWTTFSAVASVVKTKAGGTATVTWRWTGVKLADGQRVPVAMQAHSLLVVDILSDAHLRNQRGHAKSE